MVYENRCRSHHDSTSLLKNTFISEEKPREYIKKLLAAQAKKSRAIYIHVPYCSKICSFCNMNRGLLNKDINQYHALLTESIKKICTYPYIESKEFESVYFGGGTPTTLSAQQIKEVLQAIYDYLPICSNAEISFETSITELTEDRLAVMKEMGVNRFSIGVQSFVDRARKLFARRGTGQDAVDKIGRVIEMGFKNTNIDLIYNYPAQNVEELSYDLGMIKELDLAGLSYYSLIRHEGSVLDKRIKAGEVVHLASLAKEKGFFTKIYRELRKSNYNLLELTKLTNQNRDRYQYIQIRNRGGDVLALGIGAGGRLGDYSYFNGMSKEMIENNKSPLSPMGRIVTADYNRIDRIRGQLQFGTLNFREIEAEIDFDLKENCAEFLAEIAAKGLIELDEKGFELTEDGIFWGNNISRDLTNRIVEIYSRGRINNENTCNIFNANR